MRLGINIMPQLLYPQETDLVPILQENGWAPGPVWTGVDNRKSLASNRVQTPNCPAHSEWLYQLHHPKPGYHSAYSNLICRLLGNVSQLYRLHRLDMRGIWS
jgi:hypothetical protein